MFGENLFGVALLLLGFVIVNRLMALPQIRRLNKQLADLKKSGPVSSVGLARHWSGNRAYVLITDLDGNVINGYQTSGNSVFAGFSEDKKLTERHYTEILQNLEQKKKLTRVEQAKQMAAKYLQDGLQNAERAPAQTDSVISSVEDD